MSSIAIAVVVSIAALVGYTSYLIFGPENKVEQVCEEIIKSETGDKVDLSPNEEVLQQAPKVEQQQGANGPSEDSAIIK